MSSDAIKDKVAIVGMGCCKFGENWDKAPEDMIVEAAFEAYQDAGMIGEAIGELEKAVNLCPQFADLRTRLASLYRDTSQMQRAREQLELAKAANPNYAQARVLLGVVLLSAGEIAAARAEFETVLSADPDNKSAQMYLKIANASQPKAPEQG